MRHTIPQRFIEYGSDLGGKIISQHNHGNAGITFFNWHNLESMAYISNYCVLSSCVAVFRLRNFKLLTFVLMLAFASCTKHNDVQFTTFNGQKAIDYTVVIEAQQDNAVSIWSPTSSIALPQ